VIKARRFLISCGGTGGHLSPGIALAEGLAARGHRATLLISNKKVDTTLIAKYPELAFERIPGAPLAWSPAGFARFVVSQVKGLRYAWRLVRRERPAAIVGFGGFTTASVILVGAVLRVPVLLHEANRVPGRAIRLLGPLARRVYLPEGVSVGGVRAERLRAAGLPVRAEIRRHEPAAARASFGLRAEGKVLVVLGGSQGAGSLNAWAEREAERLAAAGVQVYVVTGPAKDAGRSRWAAGPDGGELPVVFSPFCDRMAELMSAADLVVSLAGAGTIAELVRCETPAMLVPYPHAADNHQAANAEYFARQGGGVVVTDGAVAGMTEAVLAAIGDGARLAEWRANLRRMDRADALAVVLADLEALIAPTASSGGGKGVRREEARVA
jgi:UDP-N-acetylglucosamine--N-acetylmuramyl-(pentapeptide) pyrophosphoryl-undecaprenol N-acetylglucosamine transferase